MAFVVRSYFSCFYILLIVCLELKLSLSEPDEYFYYGIRSRRSPRSTLEEEKKVDVRLAVSKTLVTTKAHVDVTGSSSTTLPPPVTINSPASVARVNYNSTGNTTSTQAEDSNRTSLTIKNITSNTTSTPTPNGSPLLQQGASNTTLATNTSSINGMNSTVVVPEGIQADENISSTTELNDYTINAFTNISNETLREHNITKYQKDHHLYYNSSFITDNEAVGHQYWIDMNRSDVTVHEMLSQSHRRAVTVKLKFDFPFYGHIVRNVTIATGGFLYTGEYVHSWLAATQYIAPLMANFDTSISKDSYVKYVDNGTAFTVQWEKVVLQDKPNSGDFTFQATLHQNGDIVFVYQNVPVVIKSIQDDQHPVKVGLSDAYIIDRTIFFVRRKTIYEYHRVNFDRQEIKNWTVILLNALPTCVDHKDCQSCLSMDTGFQCLWCPVANRCSTGTDRNRQDWLHRGCDKNALDKQDHCPAISDKSSHETVRPAGDVSNHIEEGETNSAARTDHTGESSGEHSTMHANDNVNVSVAGIFGILFIIALVFSLAAWALYAYRNPHTASGQFLIRYRPSQWSWKRGEARYTAATIHM